MDVQLFIDVTQMRAHGLEADVEQAGDFLVAVTLGEASQDFYRLRWP
jgi:hypothetical protein